ncbi:hypothetical protein GCM10022393_20000 [Aquimarina addita]|uniref:T9SS C-terminal target domain-containing protein n=1 Tax=Aquimarina addita TaxID=870485 RepID=A0ABP6ULJ1_9FLAO
MKSRCTTLILSTLLVISFFNVNAQDFDQDHNQWTKGWTNFDPNTTNYPKAEETIPTIIADDLFLNNDVTYLLSGNVYVTSGATLTIEDGTIIRCDHENPANLIITKGSKLIAVGSEISPIVFTSNKAPKSRASGDWGGIVIAGSGKINSVSGNGTIDSINPQFSLYGGTDENEQTSIMRFVRIEFPGRKSQSNGLSLYAIGSSSIIDNIMVSYSGQDSFNWNGGINNISKMISYKAEDDDFQISEGFKGVLDNLIAIRHPYITSPRGSYALQINGYNKDLGLIQPTELTDITVTNSTFVNLSDTKNYIHTTAAISASNSALIYINNSKISGFSDVVKFDQTYTSLAVIEKSFNMDNSFFNIHGEGVQAAYQPNTGVLNVLKYNRFTQNFVDVETLFSDPHSKAVPKFGLQKSLNAYMVMK